jgi:hypothetical protein
MTLRQKRKMCERAGKRPCLRCKVRPVCPWSVPDWRGLVFDNATDIELGFHLSQFEGVG